MSMSYKFDRLVSFGPVLVDLLNHVDRIPPSGEDAYISSSTTMVGGSFNTESAAARLGLRTVLAGTVGTGHFAELIMEALRIEGIEFVGRRLSEIDSGFCFTMVEPNAERSFVTLVGAEEQLTSEQLSLVQLGRTDFLYLSGYHLISEPTAQVVKDWLLRDQANGAAIVFDPASVIEKIDPEFFEIMRSKAFLISCNAREFEFLKPSDSDAAFYLRRDGKNPVTLFQGGVQQLSVDSYPVANPKDTTGAGDVHCGALMAGLSSGLGWQQAIEQANLAAAYSITKTGGAWGPTREIITSL
jgi:sugar/nucleoside kinase (ribokinase family)